MNTSNALCMFIKAPRQVQVKTRMQPEISVSDSTLLYRAIVEDILEQLENNTMFELFIFFYPASGFSEIKKWTGRKNLLVAQTGDDLGCRMLNAFIHTNKLGYNKTIIIGSDLPVINEQTIVDGFNFLDDSDVVLGPSKDGGYYLIGLKEPYEELFEKIPWSTERVFNRTVGIIRKRNLSCIVLKEKNDLDTFEDVKFFWKEIRSVKDVKHYTRTYEILKKISAENIHLCD